MASQDVPRSRLLLVENHLVFARTVIEEFLTEYEVDVVTTVARAHAAIEEGAVYDCVLVDYDLDDGKGDELIGVVRVISPEMPIVGVSARAGGNARLLAAGANMVCAKSDFTRVPRMLRSLLRKVQEPSEDAIVGVLLGCMVGDALGSIFEEAPHSATLVEEVAARARAPRHWKYTDDAEMALGVAESLLECAAVDPDQLVWCLARNMDVSRGYGAGTRTVLESPGRWRRARYEYWSEGSKGNGAAVRVGPVACAYAGDAKRVRSAAWASAGVTHAHYEGRAGATVIASAIAEVLVASSTEQGLKSLLDAVSASAMHCTPYTEKLQQTRQLLDRGADLAEIGTCLGTGILAVDSVPAALCVFLRFAGSFEQVVTAAVSLGGDADSIGAMAGALAGAQYGGSSIPAGWLEALEPGLRGWRYAKRLGQDLHRWRRRDINSRRSTGRAGTTHR